MVEPREWVSTRFDPTLRLQWIKIDMNDQNSYLRTSLKVRNPSTGQQETLNIKYDPSGKRESASWAKRVLKWTDYVVIFIIVVLVLIFVNSRVDDKNKTL